MPGTQSTASNCTDCLRDQFDCRETRCSTGACEQVIFPPGTRRSCSDGRNATNFDSCLNGVCVGRVSVNSSWVRLDLLPTTLALDLDYAYPRTLQLVIANALGLNNATQLPHVRVLFDSFLSRALDASLNVYVLRNWRTVAVLTAINGPSTSRQRTYSVYVELLAGAPGTPPLDTAALAQQLSVIANSSANADLRALGGVRAATVTTNPFLTGPEFIPWLNGNFLGISIGVACGVFLVTIGACVGFYWTKSAREIQGAVLGQTDSTASVQSGSSYRSESHASATAD